MRVGLVALNGEIACLKSLKSSLAYYVKDMCFARVLGVDGGCRWLEKLNIIPDEILGDFDSVHSLSYYKTLWPQAKCSKSPPEKDETDSEIAVAKILESSLDTVLIIGAFGGRLDHLLGTVQLLSPIKPDFQMILLDVNNQVRMIKGPYRFKLSRQEFNTKYISLLAISDAVRGITLSGFKYPLNDATIFYGQTVGISNELLDASGEIVIDSGRLLLIASSDAK